MNEKTLMRGNQALGEGAIRAGCRFFFGYPITPQNELFEYMAKRLPEVDGTFLQSESELSGVHMIMGAAAGGALPAYMVISAVMLPDTAKASVIPTVTVIAPGVGAFHTP